MASTDHLIELPSLPAKHNDFIHHVQQHPQTPMQELLVPYRDYDNKMREVFAQQPHHPAISEPSIVSLFGENGKDKCDLAIQARNLASESSAERQHYLIPLAHKDRKADGSPAIVPTLDSFRRNFAIFTENILSELDWSNVICAGSAVVTCLLPVPHKYAESKRTMREYYHEKIAPASDIDLFLYGLSEEEAVQKIKQIEGDVRDALLVETTTIRTKNTITIASHHPNRHVQIVLRIYKSISEILTGFDVDCSCAAFDGSQVYASARALGAYITQINTVDLSRRSPSYENRLSKYSHRGFEIYWPLLDRSRIDPTIFERSFGRVVGLSRLLVLEKLPSNTDRESYANQRREERGRPRLNMWMRRNGKLGGNFKDEHEDETPDWYQEDDISDYHSITIPYGPKFHAKKIERLLYAKDLLLNSEWNRPKDRDTKLHRHPAFFGSFEDVKGDCCGYCPKPEGSDDEERAEEESKTFISGDISFLTDNPGRQAIGSFNPITDDDWTEMAYVGNTAQLCQAIVTKDLEHVQNWLQQEGADPNQRDYTGRTPLQLAVLSSSLEIVQCLVDRGARIVARLADGKTALHLAAMRGHSDMVRALLRKSEENEEHQAEVKARSSKTTPAETTNAISTSDEDVEDAASDEGDGDVTTEGSYVKIANRAEGEKDTLQDGDENEPDVYDVNVTAWDVPVSPLHLAIANGHLLTVKVLIQEFGADPLLPVKLVHDHDKSPRAAILSLALALRLAPKQAQEMIVTLIRLGASVAQADLDQITAFHYLSSNDLKLLDMILDADSTGARRSINHVMISGYMYSPTVKAALGSAIEARDLSLCTKLLNAGASPSITFESWMASYKIQNKHIHGDLKTQFLCSIRQPILQAVDAELPEVATALADAGADINTLSATANKLIHDTNLWHNPRGSPESVLDAVRTKIKQLQEDKAEQDAAPQPPKELEDDERYLAGVSPNTYAHWLFNKQLMDMKVQRKLQMKHHKELVEEAETEKSGTRAKSKAIQELSQRFQELEAVLVARGAQTFRDLHPNAKPTTYSQFHRTIPVPRGQPRWSPKIGFGFQQPGLTDEQIGGYRELYEACWANDLETVKRLTLGVWGNNQDPLKIALGNVYMLSPFTIALCRGHVDLSRAILEIAQAQYVPLEKPAVRYRLQTMDDSDEDSDDLDSANEGIHLYSEIIDEQFTIDNIGQVQARVMSPVSPLSLLQWNASPGRLHLLTTMTKTNNKFQSLNEASGLDTHPATGTHPGWGKGGSLFTLAILMNDGALLEFLLDQAEHVATTKTSGTRSSTAMYNIIPEDFLLAVELGRTELIANIVSRTGAGMPLDNLVKESGVEVDSTPEYYQGLSIHGKKRKDWAQQAGGRIVGRRAMPQYPPPLEAASRGSLESVEWFLSDMALRRYTEFAEKNQKDQRLQTLSQVKGGLLAALSGWLTTRAHLLLHCVVMGRESGESLRLLRWILETMPGLLERKSANGITPLNLAFSLHRRRFAEALIAAGADQTTRDKRSRNILHSAVMRFDGTEDKHIPNLTSILALIDSRLIGSLAIERSIEAPGSLTPLALWLSKNGPRSRGSSNYSPPASTLIQDKQMAVYVRTILSATGGTELDLVDGTGNTPIHAVVRSGQHDILRVMLEMRPELLQRENAVGKTPYEMARDTYYEKCIFSEPPPLVPGVLPPISGFTMLPPRLSRRGKDNAGDMMSLKSVPVEQFSPAETEKSDEEKRWEDMSLPERTWEVCRQFVAEHGHAQRKLVSLREANEVARRLAARHGSRGKRSRNKYEAEGGADDEDDGQTDAADEVDLWYNIALGRS